MTLWRQHELTLAARPRGFHLITDELVSAVDLADVRVGLLHVFIQHTSASLTLNENASSDVRRDFERYVSRAVPDESDYFEHRYEGPDDMPAHIKASLMDSSLSIPIRDGRLCLGTWQGIYLCEHRNEGGRRRVVLSVFGERR